MVILLRIDFLLALVKTMLKRFITSIALFSKSLLSKSSTKLTTSSASKGFSKDVIPLAKNVTFLN